MAVVSDVSACNRAIVSALCRRFSLDPAGFVVAPNTEEKSIKGLYLRFLQLAAKEPPTNEDGVMKWISFADSFPAEAELQMKALENLNENLTLHSVLLGDGLKPSEADIVVFSALNPVLLSLSIVNKEKIPNVLRWMDYIQHKETFGGAFPLIQLEKVEFEYRNIEKKNPREKVAEGKKRPLEKDQVEKGVEVSVSTLNIQVGVIHKAWKHPTADSLLVEEIDVGEDVRQVVSGLAKFYGPDELLNRRVLVITNVKPGKLRDVLSAGLVLCASNADHTTVEPLLPPEGAKIGERVFFEGFDGKPEDVLNPKKKQFEKISPHLFTDEKGIATYRGVPFMTSAGPCTSSLSSASIK